MCYSSSSSTRGRKSRVPSIHQASVKHPSSIPSSIPPPANALLPLTIPLIWNTIAIAIYTRYHIIPRTTYHVPHTHSNVQERKIYLSVCLSIYIHFILSSCCSTLLRSFAPSPLPLPLPLPIPSLASPRISPLAYQSAVSNKSVVRRRRRITPGEAEARGDIPAKTSLEAAKWAPPGKRPLKLVKRARARERERRQEKRRQTRDQRPGQYKQANS